MTWPSPAPQTVHHAVRGVQAAAAVGGDEGYVARRQCVGGIARRQEQFRRRCRLVGSLAPPESRIRRQSWPLCCEGVAAAALYCLYSNVYIKFMYIIQKCACPSGPRGWSKVPVWQHSWVQIPLRTNLFFFSWLLVPVYRSTVHLRAGSLNLLLRFADGSFVRGRPGTQR